MGKKAESLKFLHEIGLPAPNFVLLTSEIDLERIDNLAEIDKLTVRTDSNYSNHFLPLHLGVEKEKAIELARKYLREGYEVILQEFIPEEAEKISCNAKILRDKIFLDFSRQPHNKLAREQQVEFSVSVLKHSFQILEKKGEAIVSEQEIFRILRLLRHIPFENCVAELSLLKNEKIIFWEVKS
jgi:hypothetical protein